MHSAVVTIPHSAKSEHTVSMKYFFFSCSLFSDIKDFSFLSC